MERTWEQFEWGYVGVVGGVVGRGERGECKVWAWHGGGAGGVKF
jgi:hypothetical protein